MNKPEELTNDQKIKLMEMACRLSSGIDGNSDWKTHYKTMAELITGAPCHLSHELLETLSKINIGEYHLSITPLSEVYTMSTEESDTLDKLFSGKLAFKIEPAQPNEKKTVTIEKELLGMLWIGAFTLLGHIDNAPEERRPLWHGDNKTPVTELADYKVITKTIEDVKVRYFNRKDRNT